MGVIITFILTCILMIISIIKKSTIKIKNILVIDTYLVITLVGSIIALIFSNLSLGDLWRLITADNAINPLKIIILLISITILSISLDVLGFFNFVAYKIVNKVKNNQFLLFYALFLIIAVLTVFTSNDIIILTFTLFICYFCKSTKINPIPYLIMEFVVANTFSMIFVIGNPTNIYLATFFGVDFISYFKVMWLPTIFGGLVSTVMLPLLFRKDLKVPFSNDNTTDVELKSKPLVIINLIHLAVVTILLAISNYLHFEMWLIALIAAISLTIVLITHAIIKKTTYIITRVANRVPLGLAVFVLTMFTLVSSLQSVGVFDSIYNFYSSISQSKPIPTIFVYGVSSALCDNIINNIPMSLAYANILSNLSPELLPYGLYASIIGSNVGAFLTPIGALAGIMWLGILKGQKINFGFIDFIKYGVLLTTVILAASLLGLLIIL